MQGDLNKSYIRNIFVGYISDQTSLWVLMGLRAAPTEDRGLSAAEIVFGAPHGAARADLGHG